MIKAKCETPGCRRVVSHELDGLRVCDLCTARVALLAQRAKTRLERVMLGDEVFTEKDRDDLAVVLWSEKRARGEGPAQCSS